MYCKNLLLMKSYQASPSLITFLGNPQKFLFHLCVFNITGLNFAKLAIFPKNASIILYTTAWAVRCVIFRRLLAGFHLNFIQYSYFRMYFFLSSFYIHKTIVIVWYTTEAFCNIFSIIKTYFCMITPEGWKCMKLFKTFCTLNICLLNLLMRYRRL